MKETSLKNMICDLVFIYIRNLYIWLQFLMGEVKKKILKKGDGASEVKSWENWGSRHIHRSLSKINFSNLGTLSWALLPAQMWKEAENTPHSCGICQGDWTSLWSSSPGREADKKKKKRWNSIAGSSVSPGLLLGGIKDKKATGAWSGRCFLLETWLNLPQQTRG